MNIENKIIAAIRSVTGPGFLPLHAPYFEPGTVLMPERDVATYRDVEAFEAMLARLTGFDYCIATVNGTAALHCAVSLLCSQFEPVVVPAMTFAASASAVVHASCFPVFVDCDPEGGLSVQGLENRLRECAARHEMPGAVIVTHVLGRPADLAGVLRVASDFGVPVIEDACQALGTDFTDPETGGKIARGEIAVLSFNLNKIITTGGGGALLTNNPDLAQQARHLCTTARVTHSWAVEHDAVGWNYRMPNLNARLGCIQLLSLDSFLALKRKLAHRYTMAFDGLKGVRFIIPDSASNNWINTIEIADTSYRDAIFKAMHDDGIGARALFTPLPLTDPYAGFENDNSPEAFNLWASTICLPSGVALGEKCL